jgi:hypothetical protein
VPVLFDATMYVAKGVLCISGLGDVRPTLPEDVDAAFVGQSNGLLGAAVRGELALDVALRSGYFGMRVETLEAAPPVGAEWEDVVEASFTPRDPYIVFLNYDTDALLEMALEPQPYRVRLCARNMDEAARQQLVIDEDEPLIDHYCVSFWPSPVAPDEVLRRGSQVAADKHAAREA